MPDDLRDQAKKMGLFGYAIPQEWGGLGLDIAQDVELAMELGYTSLALRSMFGTNNGIAGQVLVGFARHRRPEGPLAGADRLGRGGRLLRADRAGRGLQPVRIEDQSPCGRPGKDRAWVINGRKQYHQCAGRRSVHRLRPYPARRRRRAGDRGIPGACGHAGVEIGVKDAKMGQEGAWTSDVNFTDVRVGHDTLIGGSVDIGYRAAMTSLARGRIHIAALAVGSAQRALDESVAYAAYRHPGRHPDRQQFPTGAGHAGRPADRRARGPGAGARRGPKWLHDEDRRIAPSVAKLFCTEMAGKVADLAVQVHGAGYMRGVPGRADLPGGAPAASLRGHQRNPAVDHRRRPGQGSAARPVRLADKVAFITGAARGQAGRMRSRWPPRAPTSSPWTSPASCRTACRTTRERGGPRRDRRARRGDGRRILPAVVDVRDHDGLKTAVAQGVATLGRLDIIVANAGISPPAAWDDITPEAFRDVMDINVTGTWNTVMAGRRRSSRAAAAAPSS